MTDDLVHDAWLAGVLGKDAYRLGCRSSAFADPGVWSRIAEVSRRPVFVYTKIPVHWPVAVSQAEEKGFRLVDTNVVFERPPARSSSGRAVDRVRWAAPADRPAVVDVARRSLRCSRFHLDPLIGATTADRVKAEWVESYFAGTRGSCMVVAEAGGSPAAFLLAIDSPDGAATIDLIATDEAQRRRGLASAMIAFLQTHRTRARVLRAGTQVANTASIRLYEKLGFAFTGASYVLHYHGGMYGERS